MQKTKRTRFFVVAILIFSLVTMYADMSVARAASLESVKDTISDSDLSAIGVTHTIDFDMVNDLAENEIITLAFPAGVLDSAVLGDVSCPANTTAAITAPNITCTVNAGLSVSAAGVQVSVDNTTNPGSEGSYSITVSTDNAIEAESSDVLFYIIDDVTVTAHVDATLTFGVGAVLDGVDVNGTNTTVASTATTIPFGDLASGTAVIIGQELTVVTNAADGFSVTVQQDQDLTSAAGATIDAFVDGTAGLPRSWQAPASTLDDTTTYGHMGLTTEDESLSVLDYGTNLYAGLDGSNPSEVMYHGGPADGITDHAGVTQVAYQIEIGDLQEAGDYESTLTYICTPTF